MSLKPTTDLQKDIDEKTIILIGHFNKDIFMDNEKKENLVGLETQNNPVVKTDINVLFAGDSYGLFVFKKTEKIVTAIYLLTGLMSDKEPMREKLRTLATNMLSNALLMSERVWGEETYQKNLSSALCEMSVLFDVAETAKMISKMNHKIISDELKKLLDFLVTSSSNYSSAKIAFPSGMFDGDYNYVPDQAYQAENNNSPKDINIGKSNLSQGQEQVKDIQKKISINRVSIEKSSEEGKNIKDKNSRQEIIISMLKGGVKLTIKDFAKNIKGCSDKTIQRELIAMVSKGVLKKEGERRWSKYFLA